MIFINLYHNKELPMTKTAHQHELALDDLDAVVGGSASPMAYFHPVAIQATGTIPGVDFSSTSLR